MEDIHVLKELMKQFNWIIRIDIENLYFHITENNNIMNYRGFKFKDKIYRNIWKPFGIKHAPFVFNKTMRLIMMYFREILCIRCLDCSNDLIFPN